MKTALQLRGIIDARRGPASPDPHADAERLLLTFDIPNIMTILELSKAVIEHEDGTGGNLTINPSNTYMAGVLSGLMIAENHLTEQASRRPMRDA